MSPVRMIFAIDGDAVTLISARDVEMTMPGGTEVHAPPNERALRAEVRTADEEVLHRIGVRHPLPGQTEVFTGEADARPHWAQVEPSRGAFTIVVPNLPEADHVALLESAPVGRDGAEAIARLDRVLATFSLRDVAGEQA